MVKRYKGLIIFFYALCVILLVICAVTDIDLRIDIALNNTKKPVAIWFQNTGEMPAYLVCPIAGAILFYCCNSRWAKGFGLLVEIIGSAVLGYYIAGFFFESDYQTGFGIVWGIGFGLVLLLLVRYVKIPSKYKKVLVVLAVTGICVMAAQGILVTAVKSVWGRVRFRDLLASGSYGAFTPWYIPSGINGNRSFPSGHTSGASVVFLSMLLPAAFKKYENKMPLAFWLSFAYTAVVAVSRLVMGAHFLSDVVMGAVIGFSCALIGLWAFERYTSKNGMKVPMQ